MSLAVDELVLPVADRRERNGQLPAHVRVWERVLRRRHPGEQFAWSRISHARAPRGRAGISGRPCRGARPAALAVTLNRTANTDGPDGYTAGAMLVLMGIAFFGIALPGLLGRDLRIHPPSCSPSQGHWLREARDA